MSGIAIYMEGGGDSASSKAAIRQGMDGFLSQIKISAQAKRLRWKLVTCGGRQNAFDAFKKSPPDPDYSTRILLVDSEAPVNTQPSAHLRVRDGWGLNGAEDKLLHLMVQTMESWIVADVEALAAYYGQRFRRNALPKNNNLEQAAKLDVASALVKATRATQKGEYQKIRHAGDLLRRIDPMLVRGRCPHCDRMFVELIAVIQAA